MQTTKFLFVIGAATILAVPLQVTAAPDNEAQAKMREALRQKMEELNASSAPAPARAVPPVAPPQTIAPRQAVAPPQAPKVIPAPKPDDAAQAKMREALRQKMQEMNSTAGIAPAVVVPVPTQPMPPPTAPAKPVKPAAVEQRFSEVPAADTDAQAARMREVLRQKMAAEQGSPTLAPVFSIPAQPTPSGTPSAVVAAPPATQTNDTPAPGPASKQARLAALLQLYKADTITPQQYHTQRAKIIAEP